MLFGKRLLRPVTFVKEVHGPGKLLLQASCSVPSEFRILQPASPHSGLLSKNEIIFSNVSSLTMQSGLIKRMNFPLATFNPWLFALPKPTLTLFSISLTEGNFSLMTSTLPSSDALSITGGILLHYN